jgi:anti-anti-sigma factor
MTVESVKEGQYVRLRVALDAPAGIPVGTIGTVTRASQDFLSIRFDTQVIDQIPAEDVEPVVLGSVVQRPKKGVVLAQLKGRMTFGKDLQGVKADLAPLAAERETILILDLSNVESADSSGLGVLLYLNGIAEEAGSTLRLAGATRRLLELLKITHADKVLTLDADVSSSLSR